MPEFVSSIDFTALKLIGTAVSALVGIVMSWMSKRSVNYKKIDMGVILGAVLYFVYANVLSSIIQLIVYIPLDILYTNGIVSLENIPLMMTVWLSASVLIVAVNWGVIVRKSNRISMMMGRAKDVSRTLFLLINWLSIVSFPLSYSIVPYSLIEQQNLFTQIMEYSNWAITIWWFALMVSLIWRTAIYVFSEMKITLNDGEVIKYNCSPQMCRVHKNYVRLIKRDDKNVVIYERHINEISIKQIEYLSTASE